MNWDRIQGNWKQIAGKAKTNWGKLTHDDQITSSGRSERRAGKRQAQYGREEEQAAREFDAFHEATRITGRASFPATVSDDESARKC
ncbi:MAG: CsbD family protein [Candidatus Hydrogenedentes bacterium]|nr:CsbD family protein [Candidatus Hydrogenedentota bacterium]